MNNFLKRKKFGTRSRGACPALEGVTRGEAEALARAASERYDEFQVPRVCVCVCVWVWVRVRVRECVCTCACASLCAGCSAPLRPASGPPTRALRPREPGLAASIAPRRC